MPDFAKPLLSQAGLLRLGSCKLKKMMLPFLLFSVMIVEIFRHLCEGHTVDVSPTSSDREAEYGAYRATCWFTYDVVGLRVMLLVYV